MEKITSKNNQLIKDTKKLLTSAKMRKENGEFVLEGARLCFDVLNSFYRVNKVLVTENAYSKYRYRIDELINNSDESYLITDDIASKLTDTVASQGIFVICSMAKLKPINENGLGKVILLDNVQDPSNLGAIVRTGEALGIDAIVTFSGCDIYNPKALRASMGSMLRMNIIETNDLASYVAKLKNNGFKVYATVPDSNAQRITGIDFKAKSACVIGNEANGVSDNMKAIADMLVTIPMLGRAESLNASVAASITMWEMLR